MIDELVRIRGALQHQHSEEFIRDMQAAINALKKIKKYF